MLQYGVFDDLFGEDAWFTPATYMEVRYPDAQDEDLVTPVHRLATLSDTVETSKTMNDYDTMISKGERHQAARGRRTARSCVAVTGGG